MDSLIIDLRGNTGGYLSTVTNMLEEFIDKGNVIYQIQSSSGVKQYKTVKASDKKYKIVVLIDGGSASASEIVTGVIKDYKRGTVIGETTFGKGIVQQVIPLRSNDAIKLTIAQYFTPKGNYIHGKGIEPDIKVPMEELIALKGYTNESEEAKSIRKKELEDILLKDKGKEEADKIIANGDVQLKRAIEEISKKIK